VAIGISVWGDITDKQTYDNVTADFMKANPNIKVTPNQWVGSAGGSFYDKMDVALASGTAPDVLYAEAYNWQGYAVRGAFAPLESFRDRDKVAGPPIWPDLELFKDYTTFRGKLYGISVDTGNCLTFYEKDVFDKAGVPYPQKSWTQDDYIATAKKLTNPQNKVFGGTQQWNYLLQQALWRANGAMEFDTVLDPKKAKFDDPIVVETMQRYVTDAINTLKITPSPADIAGGAVGLQQGNVGMYHTGPWFLPQLWGPNAKKTGGVRFDVMLNPIGKSGKTAHLTDCSTIQLNAKSNHQDEAWLLMKWVASDAGQKRVIEGGRMPGTPDMTQKLWVAQAAKDYNFQNADLFLEAYNTGATPMVGGVTVNELSTKAFTPSLQAMYNGTSAKDAMAQCQQVFQKVLDDYWASQA
jgi:multiple sugar transport system substrate-binding protein